MLLTVRNSWGWRARAVTFALFISTALLMALGAPSALAQSPQPKLTGLGSDTLVVNAKTAEDTATASFPVLNAGAAGPITVVFEASDQAPGAKGGQVRIISFTPQTVAAAGHATLVHATFTGMLGLTDKAITGQLVVTGGDTPIARAVSIVPAPQPAHDWAMVIVIGAASFGVGGVLLVVLWAAVGGIQWQAIRRKMRKEPPPDGVEKNSLWKPDPFRELGGSAPGPKWSFDSWATTLTAVGAIFGTILTKATLPPVLPDIDKNTLIQLNLVFGVALVIGPFIFQALRTPVRGHVDDGLWGWSPCLLISYGITLVAVVGELGAMTLLSWELVGGGTGGKVLVGVGAFMVLLATWYFVTTAHEQVTTDWEAKAKDAKSPQKVNVVEALGLNAWPKQLPIAPSGANGHPGPNGRDATGAGLARLHARMP